MRSKVIPATVLVWFSTALILLAAAGLRAQAAQAAQAPGMKFEALLIWGTDDSKAPDPKYKPVEPDVLKKLKELPLKWSHYYEVNRTDFTVPPGAVKHVPMSEKCELVVKNLGNTNAEVEVSLIGKGKEVMKRKQSLPKGESLVLGGNAPNATAWLVMLKRLE